MQWSDLKSIVGHVLPAIGDALAGSAGDQVGKLIAGAIGCDPTPQAVKTAIQNDPQYTLKLRTLENQLQIAKIQADSSRIASVNATMQAEAKAGAAGDWRDWWGKISAVAFGIVCLGILALLFADPAKFGQIPVIISAVAGLFSIPGAILGVTAWHRGQADRILAGSVQPVSNSTANKG